MAIATSREPTRLTLADLPPALRKAAEACPFDLLPWIDLSRPIPARPLYVDLDRFCDERQWTPGLSGARTLLDRGDFFDASELTGPRLQWCVRCLIHEGNTQNTIRTYILGLSRFTAWLRREGRIDDDPLAGVNSSAWARGELEQIDRLLPVCWESLYLYEKEGATTYYSLPTILEGREDLRQGNKRERKRSLNRLSQQIQRARHVRDTPPGTSTQKRSRKTLVDAAGSYEALLELLRYWRMIQKADSFRYGKAVILRWNELPRMVMCAIAGPEVKYLRKFETQHLLYERIHRDAKKHPVRIRRPTCSGGKNCPRTQEFIGRRKREEPWEDIYAWVGSLTPDQRKAICPVHARLPASPRQVRNIVDQAAKASHRNWIAELRADPIAGHQKLGERKLRSFHHWCLETLKETGNVAGVTDRYVRMSEEEQLTLFGRVWPAGKPLPRKRRELNMKIRGAIATAKLELELERAAREAELAAAGADRHDGQAGSSTSEGATAIAEAAGADGNGRGGRIEGPPSDQADSGELSAGVDQVVETPAGEIRLDARLTAKDLSEHFGVPYGPLRRRLERFRKKHLEGWHELEDFQPNAPQYLYEVAAVKPVIDRLRMDGVSIQRPSD